MNQIRTTVRMPSDLHEQLKQAAVALKTSAEAIIQLSLRQTLPKIHFASRPDHPQDWGPLLAVRFAQFLPFPFVLKDKGGAIIYANHAYEREFGFSLLQMRSRRIEDLLSGPAVQRDSIRDNIESVLRGERASAEFVEAVTFHIPTIGADGYHELKTETVVYRSVRWMFNKQDEFLGDFTFGWGGPQRRPVPETSDLCRSVLKLSVPCALGELIQAALESAPLSIVIKKASDELESRKIVWCNRVFEEFVAKHVQNVEWTPDISRKIVDKISHDVLPITDLHQIALNDAHVMTNNESIVSDQPLSTLKGFRTIVRFPIPGPEDGKPQFIGVLSLNFGLTIKA